MTNEELYAGIKSLTDATGLLSSNMENRFDRIDARLERMDTRFDGVDARLDRHDRRFDSLETRIENIETDVRFIRHDVADIKVRLKRVEDARH